MSQFDYFWCFPIFISDITARCSHISFPKDPSKLFCRVLFFYYLCEKSIKMDKQSNHWADVLVWLERVAKSCETKEQAQSCERLVWNFHRQYQKKLGLAECFNLTKEIDKILLEFKLPAFYKKQKL